MNKKLCYYDADFVAQYGALYDQLEEGTGEETGDSAFSGCDTDHTDLAVAYGNVRTFRLLCRLHHETDYVDGHYDRFQRLENECIRNSGNHLANRHTEVVVSRAQNNFQFYKESGPHGVGCACSSGA